MEEITVNGTKYQLGKLNAFEQWHLFRRVAPMLEAFGTGMMKLPADALGGEEATGGEGGLSPDQMMIVFAPVMEAISKLTDAESDYIMFKCLNRVRRWNGSQWVPMMSHGQLMFDDLDMKGLFQLTVAVLQENNIMGFTLGDLAPNTQAEVSQSQ